MGYIEDKKLMQKYISAFYHDKGTTAVHDYKTNCVVYRQDMLLEETTRK